MVSCNSIETFWRGIKNKTILIVGIGLTGESLSRLLYKKKINFFVYDDFKLSLRKKKFFQKINFPLENFFNRKKIKNFKSSLKEIDLVLLSPGFPRSSSMLKLLPRRLPIYSEIDFFYPLLKNKKIIAITGSNGKTTVTQLVYTILSLKFRVFCGGNIGTPLSDALEMINEYDIFLLEVSSYMLEKIYFFRPRQAVIINLGKDHLDRYQSFKEYVRTKFNIIKFMKKNDFFIQNLDNRYIRKKKITHVNVHPVSVDKKKLDIYKLSHFLYFKSKKILDLSQINLMTPPINLIIAIALGIKNKIPLSTIIRVIKNAKPLEHRLERVKTKRFIAYNDSKATTVDAVISAIEILFLRYAKKIKLILGGQGKGLSFKKIKSLKSKISKFYLYGMEGLKIATQLPELEKIYVKHFDQVVHLAITETSQNEILLLSPGCASFDQFKDFQQRGRKFKEIIKSRR